MNRIGAFAGKFLPPHIGHTRQIEICAKSVDELRVVVAENPKFIKQECEDKNLPYMSGKMRVEWLKQHFKHNKKIKVLYMDESGLSAFPDGMKEWSERFKQIVGYDVNVKFADESYRELNQKFFPECEFVAFDRTVVPISGTLIRQNPEKYFSYIIDEAKDFLIKKSKNQKKVKERKKWKNF